MKLDSILTPMPGKPLLIEILNEELRRRPQATPTDLRKLVMQSVLGGDHLFRDPDRFRRGLENEWLDLPAPEERQDSEPLLQLIDPDGRTARIHLLPCRDRGIRLDDLSAILLEQPLKCGLRREDTERWEEVIALASAGALPFGATDLELLRILDGPAHHSSSYGFTAYRILNDITHPVVASWLEIRGVHL